MTPLRLANSDEVDASAHRSDDLKRRHRESIGWIGEAEFRRMGAGTDPKVADAVWEEIKRQRGD